MTDDDATANITDGEGSSREASQAIDINPSLSSPVRAASSARYRGAGGVGAGVGGLRRDPSVSVGPRVYSKNVLSPPMPPSLVLAGETQSYYSNHYNKRWDAWRDIRFKTWTEVREWEGRVGGREGGREEGKGMASLIMSMLWSIAGCDRRHEGREGEEQRRAEEERGTESYASLFFIP